MACIKLGSKPDTFHQRGQAWFCTTRLPSDAIVEVEQLAFHLHKFPLSSKSGLLERLIKNSDEKEAVIKLPNVPGGAQAFELVAKFCYGVKIELTSSNVVCLRCAAEYLEMTEEIAEGNLIGQTEIFINQDVLHSWKDSIEALRACDDLPNAENLQITKTFIESLAVKACADAHLFGWPMEHDAMESSGGGVLWNGINPGARHGICSSDWWYEDVCSLSFPSYKTLISAMKSRGLKHETIAGSLICYAKQYLPGLDRRQNAAHGKLKTAPSDEEQKHLLEEIDSLLPVKKGVASTKILIGFLRTATILQASPTCLSNLEKRIGMQLDKADLEDLLFPTFAHSMEALYDVDCVQRMLEYFLAMDQANGGASLGSVSNGQSIGSPFSMSIITVAKLVDGYLAEIAPDINLKLTKFQCLAASIPDYARALDDELYRAIDIYIKAHPWLSESDREQVCRLMDCQKLSLGACTHAAQNERLPLRVIVQVLFFEQLQLRTSVAGCLLASDNLDGSQPLRGGIGCSGETGGWMTAIRENQALKVGMDSMRMRVSELEKECASMKQGIDKLRRGRSGWINTRKKLGPKSRLHMCSALSDSVGDKQKVKSGYTCKTKQQSSPDA